MRRRPPTIATRDAGRLPSRGGATVVDGRRFGRRDVRTGNAAANGSPLVRIQMESGVPRIEYEVPGKFVSLDDILVVVPGDPDSFSAMEMEFLTSNAEALLSAFGFRLDAYYQVIKMCLRAGWELRSIT